MLEAIEEAKEMKLKRGVKQRAAILVTISGPYHKRVAREINRVPLANVALAGTVSAFYAGMTTGPYTVVQRAVDSAMGGPPTTPERIAVQRRAILAGTMATVATGVLAQRVINQAGWGGPVAEAGRVVGSQLAIGGAASAIVLGTDMVLGPAPGTPAARPPVSVIVVTTIAQRRALRRIVPKLRPPRLPRTVTLPVKNGWRIRDKQLQLMP
jgi:hypothetical protein